jgi:CheY-like chemotaxis protein
MIAKQNTPLHVLLAEDDIDDYFIFTKALNEINLPTKHTRVADGEQLMKYLFTNLNNLPDVLFLDLSMPRKTGFECMVEIEENNDLFNIPVIVFTTSFTHSGLLEQNLKNIMFNMGANSFIRKTGDFNLYKRMITLELEKLVTEKQKTLENNC